MITVIAPHARLAFSENLIENFRRQRGVEARLLVVENGPAVGSCPRIEGAWFVRSDPHQADAMNTGLEWLQTHGDGPWARFDDDDYYGPDYLAEVEQGLREHCVVGQTWGFVLFDDGLYRFGGIQRGPAQKLAGGTLAARSSYVAPFERRMDDDLQWCRDMLASGVQLFAGSHRSYCYDRRSARAGEPRVVSTGPAVTRWGFGGDAEFYGPLLPFSVDRPDLLGRPRIVSRPTDGELLAEVTSHRL